MTTEAAAPPVLEHPFEFRGEAGEYFRIWIVNLALTILTLGVYSAWAKVRANRYFYSNTRVAGTPFEYQARPVRILIGRAIALAGLGLYLLAQQLVPVLEAPTFAVLLVAMPWLLVMSLRFRARYSAWSGLNFRFAGHAASAYGPYFFGWILSALSAGLAYPAVQAWQKRFVVENHRFGGERFRFPSEIGDFYRVYLTALGLAILIAGGGVALGALVSSSPVWPGAGDGTPVAVLLPIAGFYAAYLVFYASVDAGVWNLVYDGAGLGPHRLRSELRVGDLIRLHLTNTLALLATLGLARPWVQIRMARYRAGRSALLARGSLDDFVAEAREREPAVAAEMADLLDLDLGL
jgi:uncharacterized membrane protein YjgN (DUF898 family)